MLTHKTSFIVFIPNMFSLKQQHTWTATPALIDKLNLEIQKNDDLRAYANPIKKTSQNAGKRDHTRGSRKYILNIEFENTGGFQIILDWLQTSTTCIWHQDYPLVKQCSYQQRIDPTYDQYKIWFAAETWYLVRSDNASVILRSNNQLTTIEKSSIYFDLINNFLSYAKSQLNKDISEIKSFNERQNIFQTSLQEQIDEIEDPKTLKVMQKLLYKISPICIMKGQGAFEPEKKLFCLSDLDMNYPGVYKTNPCIDALTEKNSYDLRPEIIKSSTVNTFKKCIDDNVIDRSKFGSKRQSWWHYVRINNISCISSIKFMRSQLRARPYWNLAILLLISIASILLMHFALHITLLNLIASKPLIFTLGAAASIMIGYCAFVFIDCAHSLETLPDEETSNCGRKYTKAAEFKTCKKPDTDQDPIVTVIFEEEEGQNHDQPPQASI